MGVTTIEDAAGELYGTVPERFVAARNALAAGVRRDGDRDLAARIAALPKPSAGAWAVNALVRDKAAQLGRIADLGDRYRDAERQADRAALIDLNRERKTLLGDLTARAHAIADDVDHELTAKASDELAQTLRAGITDAVAAAAILSGRLVSALSADGVDAVDVQRAVAGAPAPKPARAKDSAGAADRAAERRAAERASIAAEKAWKKAEAERAKLAARATTVEREVGDLEDELRALEARLDEARERAERVASELSEAELAEAETAERAARTLRGGD
jgi:hypothetical protein